jgi:hypothetical protein
MVVKVSARRNGAGTFAGFYGGRKVFDGAGERVALQWVSDQLRKPDHELSRHSTIGGADVAAFRASAGQVEDIGGAAWVVNRE